MTTEEKERYADDQGASLRALVAEMDRDEQAAGVTPALRAARLLELAGLIERAEWVSSDEITAEPDWDDACRMPQGFNMRIYNGTAECGTVGCIAGWAATRWYHGDVVLDHVKEAARVVLGLDGYEANCLFEPHLMGVDLDRVGPRDAAQACRRLAAGDDAAHVWGRLRT